jgi:pyruvate/2-oxoglutarate dehydrogenase complex dihydrolipoamide dehydrogenase (E3) component
MAEQAEYIVVGLGIAGEEIGGTLAEAGRDVVGVERSLVGGECPYWGCLPSKMMIRAANLLAEARRIPGMAGEATVTPDWGPVQLRIREEATDHWNDQVAVDRFTGKGGRFVRGSATITGPRSVEVDGTTYEASKGLVITAGAQPAIPSIPGIDDVPYWTNHEATETDTLPDSLIVLGGGVVGLELGQAMARFGTKVTIIEAQDRLLPLHEPEAGAVIEEVLTAEGIAVRTGVVAERVSKNDDGGVTAHLSDGSTLDAAQLLVATGRTTDFDRLGIAAAGLDASARYIEVDARMRPLALNGASGGPGEGIWAVGDITGVGAFTHLSNYQAAIAIADILGNDTHDADYRALASAAFTDPEVGTVGLTEQQARETGLNIRIGTQQVQYSARGWLHKAGNEGFIKLIEDTDRGVLVGATSVGPHGGEVLGLLTLAIHTAVPIEEFRRMHFAYPTFHKGVEDALRDLVSD